MSLARHERAALVSTLRSVGPDAPTMCAGWTTRDLAVHLIVRERRLDATAAGLIPGLRSHAHAVTSEYEHKPWPVLLRLILDGPPWYSPFRPIDGLVNLAEMFVHHEDILRGGADPDGPFLPRKVPDEVNRALEGNLKLIARLTMANSPARVTLGSTDGRELLTVGSGEPVTVSGSAGELLLFAFGRAPVDVTATGPEEVIARLWAAERSV